jgi:excisionase family DNA binding protein
VGQPADEALPAGGLARPTGDPTGERVRFADEETFTTADVAERLGVSENTVRKWEREGELPPVRRGHETSDDDQPDGQGMDRIAVCCSPTAKENPWPKESPS